MNAGNGENNYNDGSLFILHFSQAIARCTAVCTASLRKEGGMLEPIKAADKDYEEEDIYIWRKAEGG